MELLNISVWGTDTDFRTAIYCVLRYVIPLGFGPTS